jgi:hypothetical protein
MSELADKLFRDHQYADNMMHYCEGTWREGYVSDCEEAEEHQVKLISTDAQHKAAVMRLGGK